MHFQDHLDRRVDKARWDIGVRDMQRAMFGYSFVEDVGFELRPCAGFFPARASSEKRPFA